MSESIVLEMAGTYAFKPRFQKVLRPFVAGLAAFGLRANQVTLFAGALSVGFGILLLTSTDPYLFQLLPLVLFIRMALNAMDGMLAREFGQATHLGIYLNELADVISDAFLILPFAHLRGFSPFWIWNVVALAMIAEIAGILGAMAGASRRYDGPMGKSDRALVFGAAGLWAGLAGAVPKLVASVLPKALVVLLVFTIIQRVRNGLWEAALCMNSGE